MMIAAFGGSGGWWLWGLFGGWWLYVVLYVGPPSKILKVLQRGFRALVFEGFRVFKFQGIGF